MVFRFAFFLVCVFAAAISPLARAAGDSDSTKISVYKIDPWIDGGIILGTTIGTI
jgi:hypothetical protein